MAVNKLTTTEPALRKASTMRAISKAAKAAFRADHYNRELGLALVEQCVKAGIAPHRAWPPLEVLRASASPERKPIIAGPAVGMPHAIESLHCPACAAVIDIPEKGASIQCVKCLKMIRIDVVVKRSITLSLHD